MRRGPVEILAQIIGNCPEIPSPNQGPGRPPVPVHVQVQVTLWYLGHNDSYYEIAERFSVAASAAFNSVKRVCSALANNYINELIKWPTGQKLIDTIDAFERMKGFPGVVGAIDCTHIPIKAPKENRNDYINRKFFRSIQLHAVCDADLLCIDAFCGFPRKVHDARIFCNSPPLKMQEVVQTNCFQVTRILFVIPHIRCRNGY